MTVQRGIQIGRFLMGAGNQIAGAVQNSRDNEDSADEAGYLEQLMRGEHPEAPVPVAPQAEGPDAAGPQHAQPKTQPAEIKNPKALSKAYAQWYKQQMQKDSFRAMELKKQDEISQSKREDAENLWAQYNGLLKAGNEEAAIETGIKMINDYPNGQNYEYDRRSKTLYEMDEKDGQLVRGKERPMFTREEIGDAANFMFDEENFNKSYVAQYRANKAHNISILETGGKRVTDKDGNTAGYKFDYVDAETGKPDWQFSGINTEGTEKWNVAQKRDDLRIESEALGVEKAKADIAEKKSKTEHRGLTEARAKRAEAKKDVEKKPTIMQQAEAYVKTKQAATIQEGMALVRSDKSIADRIRLSNIEIENLPRSERSGPKAKAIREAYGVTAETVNPMLGIGKAKRADTAAKNEDRKLGIIQDKAKSFEDNKEAAAADVKKWLAEGKTREWIKKELKKKYSK